MLTGSSLFPRSLRYPRLAFAHGRQRVLLVCVRSQPRAIGEVAALVALLSGIALSPEGIVGTVGAKNRDPPVVFRSRTSRLSPGLPFSSPLDVPWLGYSQPLSGPSLAATPLRPLIP